MTVLSASSNKCGLCSQLQNLLDSRYGVITEGQSNDNHLGRHCEECALELRVVAILKQSPRPMRLLRSSQ